MTTFDLMVNRWLGVSGFGDCEEFMVFTTSGLQLTIVSDLTMKVLKGHQVGFGDSLQVVMADD